MYDGECSGKPAVDPRESFEFEPARRRTGARRSSSCSAWSRRFVLFCLLFRENRRVARPAPSLRGTLSVRRCALAGWSGALFRHGTPERTQLPRRAEIHISMAQARRPRSRARLRRNDSAESSVSTRVRRGRSRRSRTRAAPRGPDKIRRRRSRNEASFSLSLRCRSRRALQRDRKSFMPAPFRFL